MIATFGGGCFWCTEACFELIRGVSAVESGYAGGRDPKPDYKSVCSGVTGHAEVIRVTFDPAVVSYRELLLAFFATHDPTTKNRQGADVGTQYRSVIFTHDDEQKATAEAVVAELTADGVFSGPIVTEISPLTNYHPAEEYHQGYYRANPNQGYCQAVVGPKVAKLRKAFAGLLK